MTMNMLRYCGRIMQMIYVLIVRLLSLKDQSTVLYVAAALTRWTITVHGSTIASEATTFSSTTSLYYLLSHILFQSLILSFLIFLLRSTRQ